MRQFIFESTKERPLLKQLRSLLERRGWKILCESGHIFKGATNYDQSRQNPSLLGTWSIQRRTSITPIILEFIGGFHGKNYDLALNTIDNCMIKGTDIELWLYLKDRTCDSFGFTQWILDS